MQTDNALLRDVELRLGALEEFRRLDVMLASALSQLTVAKAGVAHSESGSLWEQKYLKEALEASERLAALRESQMRVERELRRTAYLLEMLSAEGK